MSKKRKFPWLLLIALVPGLVLTFAAGLWVYVSATTKPLHPDAQALPSVSRSDLSSKFADAVALGRQAVRASIIEQNLPGVSIAVGLGGNIVWSEGFGWADLDTRTSVTPETRFRTGDAARTLTSAAVGLLLEKDQLKLDDEIHKYVPDYPKKPWPITLRQLMGETAGLTTDDGDEAWLNPCKETAEGLKLFAKHDLLFEPGTAFRPSNYGWILVSSAVEAAADEQFFAFMRRQVFEPLSMTDTVPDTSSTDTIPNRATFYFPRFAGDTRYGPESVREGDHSCYAGATGFLATSPDLVRFGMGIRGGKLLQTTTVDTLQTPERLASGKEIDYGLGWALETVALAGQSTRMAGHGTKTDFIGGTTYLMTFPERGLVVAVMTNESFADAKSIALSVAQVFAKHAGL